MQQHIATRRKVLRLRILELVVAGAFLAGGRNHPRWRHQAHVHPRGPASATPNTGNAFPAGRADLPEGLQTPVLHGEPWRLYVMRLRSGLKVAVGQKTAGRDEVARDDALRTVIPLVVLLPILLLLIGGVIRGMLRPVTRLGAEVDARSEHDLRPLSAAGGPREEKRWGRGMSGELKEIAPVQIGEEVSPLFAFAKKFEIDLAGGEIFVEAMETQEMLFGPLRGVFGRAVGLD